MKKLLFFLGVLFSAGMVTSVQAQTDIIIGAGTNIATCANSTTADGGPTYVSGATSTFVYSKSHYVFTAAELATASLPPGSLITKVAWYKANAATYSASTACIFDVYVKNSTATGVPTTVPQSFANIISGATQAYTTTTQSFSSAIGWVDFNFSSPFLYTGDALEITTSWNVSAGGTSSSGASSAFAWAKDPGTNTLSYCGAAVSDFTYLRTTRAQIRITYIPGGPCVAPPTAGQTTSSASSMICAGQSVNLNVIGNTNGTGQTYQWESSSVLGGPYTPFGSSSTSAGTTVNPTTTTYYRLAVTCSGFTDYSVPVHVQVAPTFPGGTYTINSAIATGGTNFQSFTDAMAAIGCGISGPIVLNVTTGSGPYTEQIIIPNTIGSNSTNTVTINGNGATVQHSATVASTAVLMIDGADYVKIDSLVFKSLNTANGSGAMLYNGCDFDTITRCTFDLSSVTGTVATNHGIRISTTPTTTSTTASGATNTYIANCAIIGSTTGNNGIYYGLYAYGPNSNNAYYNNTISNSYLYSMYVYYGDLNIISNNRISRLTKTGTGYCYGMVTGFLTGGSQVIKNRIEYLGGSSNNASYCYPLQMISTAGTAAAPVLVANNVIANMTSVPLNGGIYINAGTNVDVFHNTISIDLPLTFSTTTVQSGIQNASATANIKNNIVSYTGGGPNTKYGLYYGTTPASSDYNNVYMNSIVSGTQSYGYRTSAHATLAAFQTATSLETNGHDYDPMLVQVNGLPTPTNALLDNLGTPIATVSEDIQGALRNIITPDMGALEFVPPTCSGPTGLVSGGTTTTDITVNWTASSSNPVLGYEYYYSTANVAPTATTLPSGSVGQGVTTATITGLPSGTQYYVWVRSNCGGSGYSFWSGPLSTNTMLTNDEASGAIPLTVNPDYNCGSAAIGTTIGATQSIDPAPSCNPTGINDDVWYSFQATSTEHRVTLYGLNNVMSVALYTGSVGSLTQVPAACGATTVVLTAANLYATGLNIGTTYYLRAYTNIATVGTTSNFTICVGTISTTPPVNDPCTNSVDITNGQVVPGSQAHATQSIASCNTVVNANDVWYHFTTGNTGGSVTVTVISTYADMVMEVLSGTCGGTMTGLIPTASTTATGSCLDGPAIGTEFGTYTVAANTTYFARVYGYTNPINNDQGTFTIQATGTPLAIKLADISATNIGSRNRIDWSTASEMSGDKFDVQRRTEGQDYVTLATINARGTASTYSYWDDAPAVGKNYYRLYIKDATGNGSYSKEVVATVKEKGGFTVSAHPNPVSDKLQVTTYGAQGNEPMISVVDITGKVVKTMEINGSTTEINMRGMAKGMYLIRYTDNTQTQTIRINKQ